MSTDAEKSARESMEKSRLEVMECEEEIKSIKNALKSLTMGAASGGDSSLNHLEVSIQKVKAAEGGNDDAEGDDSDAPTTTFKVHLSSPIEERTISKLFDPLNPTAEESLAKFESVETSNALLTVEVYSADGSQKLGESAPHDLLPLKGGEKKSTTLDLAIIAEKGMDDLEKPTAEKDDSGEAETDDAAEAADVKENESESWEDAVEEEDKEEGEVEKSENKSEEGEGKETEGTEEKEATDEAIKTEDKGAAESETKEESAEEPPAAAAPAQESKTPELQLPIYTLTIQMDYTPSTDDKRDALYDKLNEISKRKVAAINELRKSAGLVNRAKAAEAATSGPSGGELATNKKPAVKPGFLNKSKEEKAPPFWKRWYEKTIGPKSMFWVVGPIAKNYVIFAGISIFIHYKGDLLALPPPV